MNKQKGSSNILIVILILLILAGGWYALSGKNTTAPNVEVDEVVIEEDDVTAPAVVKNTPPVANDEVIDENKVEATFDEIDDWIVYENDLFKLKHPENCRIKDYLNINKNLEWLDTTISFVGVCDVGNDSLGSIRVITDSLDDVIKLEMEIVSSNDNQSIISVESTKIGNYQTRKIKKRNETTLLEYSTIVFSQNELTFILNGVDSKEPRWDMKKILSSVEIK
ncbi:MAG: hypothetical protein ACI840_002303 [Ulvibacter sp.]|jgi:hypothetical protein